MKNGDSLDIPVRNLGQSNVLYLLAVTGEQQYTRQPTIIGGDTVIDLKIPKTELTVTISNQDKNPVEQTSRSFILEGNYLAKLWPMELEIQQQELPEEPEEPDDGECVFTIPFPFSKMPPDDPVPEVILDFCDPDSGDPSRVISYELREETYKEYVFPYYYFKVKKGAVLRTYAKWEVGGGALSGYLTASNKQFDWSNRRSLDNPFYMSGGPSYYRLQVTAKVPSEFTDGRVSRLFYFALEESEE